MPDIQVEVSLWGIPEENMSSVIEAIENAANQFNPVLAEPAHVSWDWMD